MLTYRPPLWLPDGHTQTIVPALLGSQISRHLPEFARSKWNTPDDDFIEVDILLPQGWRADTPILILFHGLEGSSASHYATAFGLEAWRRGWAYAVPHFRGCSGTPNVQQRAYHSGDSEEIDWILRYVHEKYGARSIVAVGISLGGNALAKWVCCEASGQSTSVCAAASVCSPLDLGAAAECLDKGISKVIYVRTFLKTMKEKAQAKWLQWPYTFDIEAVQRATTLREFDDAFTAPLHGFLSAADYWQNASAAQMLGNAALPLLLLNTENDPFVPVRSLPDRRLLGPTVEQWLPRQGGHVGFPGDVLPFGKSAVRFYSEMPMAVCNWLASKLIQR